MKRRLIATVLSLALAATSFTTAPARADEDLAKIVGGLVVLGVIAKAIERDRERDKKREAARVSRNHVQPAPIIRRHNDRRHGYKRPEHRRHAKIAPQRCLSHAWTYRGKQPVFEARCMKRHTRAQLPQDCLRQNRTLHGPRYFYSPRCLRHDGWRV